MSQLPSRPEDPHPEDAEPRVDTAYSEKDRKMGVFAPADQPLVIYAGDEENESTLRIRG